MADVYRFGLDSLTTFSRGANVNTLMPRLRRILSRIAVAWLVCHAATLTLAPIHLWLGSVEALLECKCTHGDHAICPMHHKPAPGSRLCVMGSASEDGVAVPASLFSGVGPLPTHTYAARPESHRALFVVEYSTLSLRPPPPDPPPPRL